MSEEVIKPSIQDPNEDIRDFIPDTPLKIKTRTGEEITIPEPVWRQDLIITESIVKVVNQVIGTKTFQTFLEAAQKSGSFNIHPSVIMGVIAEGCSEVPKQLTKICAAAIDKDETFVLNELDMPTVLRVVVPTLRARVDLVVSVLAEVLG